jgi:hypothetical protein
VSVALVLIVATGLAAYALRRAFVPAELAHEAKPNPVPSTSAAPEPEPATPPALPSTPHKTKAPPHNSARSGVQASSVPRDAAPAMPPRSSDQSATPEPQPASSNAGVYPALKPIPELPPPE